MWCSPLSCSRFLNLVKPIGASCKRILSTTNPTAKIVAHPPTGRITETNSIRFFNRGSYKFNQLTVKSRLKKVDKIRSSFFTEMQTLIRKTKNPTWPNSPIHSSSSARYYQGRASVQQESLTLNYANLVRHIQCIIVRCQPHICFLSPIRSENQQKYNQNN